MESKKYGAERLRTDNMYNLHKIPKYRISNDKWEFPKILCDNTIPEKLIGFNYLNSTSKNKKAGIHFYLDDYQFERIWRRPEDYINRLSEFECILSPDFSLYMDMPYSMKVWNTYRSRWVGAYYQDKGLKVIPTISWGGSDTFDFAFSGIPQHSIVSISTVGIIRNKKTRELWKSGVDELIKNIQPKTILIYGKEVEYNFQDIQVKYYPNENSERWH